MNLNELAGEVDRVTPATPLEDVRRLLAGIEAAKAQVRLLESIRDSRVVEWIEANGPIELGKGKYIVTQSKREIHLAGADPEARRHTQRDLFRAIAVAVGGDEDAIASHFAADTFKPGACRQTLGDAFGRFFVESRRVTPKHVEKLDTTYARAS